MLFSIQYGSSKKVVVASWLFKADAVVELLLSCVYRHTLGGRWRIQWTVWRTYLFWNQKPSLGWAVQKSWSCGAMSRGEAILLLWPGHGCKRLSCNGWAEPDNESIQPWYCCLSSEVVGVDEVVFGILLQGLVKQGDSAGRACLDDEQSCMHLVKCWGTEGLWCLSIYHLCRKHMSPLGGSGTWKVRLLLASPRLVAVG